jgi:hypothetical protein
MQGESSESRLSVEGAPPPSLSQTTNPDRHVGASNVERRPVDKTVLAIPELKRLRDKDHLRFVANHSCLVCGRLPTEAHHLKFSQPSALGRKVSDAFVVPLCALHHRDLHTTGNELAWWERKKIDPLPTARNLWAESHGWPLDGEALATKTGSDVEGSAGVAASRVTR